MSAGLRRQKTQDCSRSTGPEPSARPPDNLYYVIYTHGMCTHGHEQATARSLNTQFLGTYHEKPSKRLSVSALCISSITSCPTPYLSRNLLLTDRCHHFLSSPLAASMDIMPADAHHPHHTASDMPPAYSDRPPVYVEVIAVVYRRITDTE